MEQAFESIRVYHLVSGGVRRVTLLPNGQMSRIVQQSHLVPSKPERLSEIVILPGPYLQYKDNMNAPWITTVPSMLREHLTRIDIKHKITSVKGFAAHLGGTTSSTAPLTPDFLQSEAHLFTVWYYLTTEDGRHLCIEVGHDMSFAQQEFQAAETSCGMYPLYGSDRE